MYNAGIVDKLMFNICMGKNGGYFQIGGYNTDKHLESVKWVNMTRDSLTTYHFPLAGVAMLNESMQNSEIYSRGFIDSGTTFSYLPVGMWKSLKDLFDNYCKNAKLNAPSQEVAEKYCPGERFVDMNQGSEMMCFHYSEYKFPNKKEWFLGYPIINIMTLDSSGKKVNAFKWFPSEYFYLETDERRFCLAADQEGYN